jgi:hypothetical protein
VKEIINCVLTDDLTYVTQICNTKECVLLRYICNLKRCKRRNSYKIFNCVILFPSNKFYRSRSVEDTADSDLTRRSVLYRPNIY